MAAKMDSASLIALAVIAVVCTCVSSQLVPAIIIFGDSAVDTGNNDYLHTIFKANFPPYGRDYPNRTATGRFSNGKLVTDLTAETLGFTGGSPPPYLSPKAAGRNLLVGANFASAGSGYDDKTALLSNVLSVPQQLEYFKEYKGKLAQVAGGNRSAQIIRDALYIVSFGSSDFVQNYYINPILNKFVPADQYSSYLVSIFSDFIKSLYAEGARRIGVNSLPPLGCLPISKTIFGHGEPGCVSRFNSDAQNFNRKLNATAVQLVRQLPGLRLAIFDIYQPLLTIINRPSDNGFAESSRGCCGTGTIETTVVLCNSKSIGTCPNATAYVFWDSVHPTESAYTFLSNSLLLQGIALIA